MEEKEEKREEEKSKIRVRHFKTWWTSKHLLLYLGSCSLNTLWGSCTGVTEAQQCSPHRECLTVFICFSFWPPFNLFSIRITSNKYYHLPHSCKLPILFPFNQSHFQAETHDLACSLRLSTTLHFHVIVIVCYSLKMEMYKIAYLNCTLTVSSNQHIGLLEKNKNF